MYKDREQQRKNAHKNYIKNKDLVCKRSRERYLKNRKPCPVCGKLIGGKSTKCGVCKLKERNPCIFKNLEIRILYQISHIVLKHFIS